MPQPHRNHYPDPAIAHDHYRVLPLTTGGYVVVDDRKAVGDQMVKDPRGVVRWWKHSADAGEMAMKWATMQSERP